MIHNLVISGGSTKTVAAIGCIKYLEERNMLANVINYVGTSAGSILCLLLIAGYRTTDIIKLLNDEMIKKKRFELVFDELLDFNVLNSYGLDSGQNIEAFIRAIVSTRYGQNDITFIELAKLTGKNLVVCVGNLTKQCQEYIDVETYPNMSVVQAVRMSVSLPFVFTPVKYNGSIYVDGAVYEALPVGYMTRFTDPLKDTLAIHTRTVIDTKINSFTDYLKVLVSSVMDKANSLDNISAKVNIFEIMFDDKDAMPIDMRNMKFDMNSSKMIESIDHGYCEIRQRFEQQNL